MVNQALSGTRCRAIRTVPHPKGAVPRHAQGTIRYGMENLGRELLHVDWDDGKATMVFPTDVEVTAIQSS